MKIRFLGTGAAEGVPAIFCKCPTCQTARKRGGKEIHTRTQVWIDKNLSIDFPPDAYHHALEGKFDYSGLSAIFVTHSHMDHFYAHDFILRGYKYTQTQCPCLHIYGNAEVGKVYEECIRREMRDEVRENIRFHEIRPFIPVKTKGYTVTPLLAQHSKTETAFVYFIERNGRTYLYLTDTGRLPIDTLDYLQTAFEGREQKINAVCFDCTFLFGEGKSVARHMSLTDNKIMQEEFARRGITDAATVFAITHYSHNAFPLRETLERAQQEYGYLPTCDGYEIEI